MCMPSFRNAAGAAVLAIALIEIILRQTALMRALPVRETPQYIFSKHMYYREFFLLPVKKTAGKKRVLLYGSSPTGNDIDERLLQQRFPDIEWIKMVIPGGPYALEMLSDVGTLEKLRPDLLVINVHPATVHPYDAVITNRLSYFPVQRLWRYPGAIPLRRQFSLTFQHGLGWLFPLFQFRRAVRDIPFPEWTAWLERPDGDCGKKPGPPPTSSAVMEEKQKRFLEIFFKEIRGLSIPLLIWNTPHNGTLEPHSDIISMGPEQKQSFRLFMQEMARRYHFDFIEAEETLLESGDFRDPLHLAETGARKFTHFLAPAMERLLLSNERP